MRNAEDCHKRAVDCQAAANAASTLEAKRQWADLSQLWQTIANQRLAYNAEQTAKPTATIQSIRQPVDLAKLRSGDAIGIADILRERLSLDEHDLEDDRE